MADFPTTFARIDRLPQYAFETVGGKMRELRAQGVDVVDMGMGNPDQPPNPRIIEKLQEAAGRIDTHRYSQSRGIPRLRQAVCNWYKKRYDVELDSDSETIVTVGSKEGLAHLSLAMFSSGDNVIVGSPSYPVHTWGPIIAGATVHPIKVFDLDQFLHDLEAAIANIVPKPKALIINFPSNPATQCVELDFFEKLVALAKEHGIWIIHDLAYAEICFDGYKPPSFLQVDGAKDVGVEFYSLSKTFNMPGWRVGFCSGNHHLIQALTKMKSYLDYGTYTPIQIASIVAIEEGEEWAQETAEMYRKRRNVLCSGLHELGWEVHVPKATMFVWAKLPEKLAELGSLEASLKLLNEANVAVTPGATFGQYGEGYVRMALIENEHRIRQALRSMRRLDSA